MQRQACANVAPAVRNALLLATLFVVPGVFAGSARDPEIQGGGSADDPRLDVVAAWFENTPQGVRFSVQVLAMHAPMPDAAYFVSFVMKGERVFAAVGFDGDARLHSYAGPLPAEDALRGIETFGAPIVKPRFEPGTPARLTAIIPWDAVDALEPGVTLIDLAAGTSIYDRRAQTWSDAVDFATSSETFAVKRVLLEAGAIPYAFAIGGGTLLLAVGALVVRRGRAAPAAPDPKPPQQAESARVPLQGRPDDGRRFKLDPRQKETPDSSGFFDKGRT